MQTQDSPNPNGTMSSCSVTVVFMGDSITFGQYIETEKRWANGVSERLLQIYLNTPVNLRLLVHGVSGETTRQGLERFPKDVQEQHPDVLTLQFGLNDCNCWQSDKGLPRVSPEAFRANLFEMIERARRFGARHIILSNNHRTLRRTVMLSGERYEDANERYSEIIRDVAGRAGVTFCDIRTAFARFSDDELEGLLLPYPDQLHLSPAGNRVYEETIWPLVRDAVAETVTSKASEIVYEERH